MKKRKSEPDGIDVMIEVLLEMALENGQPHVRQFILDNRRAIEIALAAQVGGFRYNRTRSELTQQDIGLQVLSLFNGRNATEVARRLQISRATVYRIIKQPAAHASTHSFSQDTQSVSSSPKT